MQRFNRSHPLSESLPAPGPENPTLSASGGLATGYYWRIVGTDSEGRATFANRAAATMLGLEAHEIVGAEVHPLFHHHRADGTPYPAEECSIRATLLRG